MPQSCQGPSTPRPALTNRARENAGCSGRDDKIFEVMSELPSTTREQGSFRLPKAGWRGELASTTANSLSVGARFRKRALHEPGYAMPESENSKDKKPGDARRGHGSAPTREDSVCVWLLGGCFQSSYGDDAGSFPG